MGIQPGGTSVGQTVTNVSSLGATAIPTLDTGERPKWVHVALSGGFIWIRFGQSGMDAVTATNGIGVSTHSTGLIINVAGQTHYDAIANSTSTSMTMTPLAGVFTNS